MSYQTELLKKEFKANIVIKFLGQYFCVRQPDSGLSVPASNIGVVSKLTLNPTTVDLRRATTTIASYGFTLLDKDLLFTQLARDRGSIFFNIDVEIWIGRNTGSFAFSSYLKLPITKIKTIKHVKNSYQFTSVEAIDRVKTPIFDVADILDIAVNSSATTITAREDITDYPASGILRIDNEFMTYTAKNNGTKQFTSVTRGTHGSTAVSHAAGVNISNVVEIQDNPLNILLQLLISEGGGGTYDVLDDGVGLDQTLVDVAGIAALRDSNFADEEFYFLLHDVGDAMQFIEDEILLACNLRFSVAANSKITVVLLDQSVFGVASESITDSTITEEPQWVVTESKLVNVINISWDYEEDTGYYRRRSTFRNETSITDFGERPPLNLTFKGIKDSLDGDSIVASRGNRLLERFSTPTPEITLKTHIDKSLTNVGDKVTVVSGEIPSIDGTLNFASELEVLSRAINHETGDVIFKLAFTSYSGIRGCYISPSDFITGATDQHTVTLPSGKAADYKVGWFMDLWNDDDQDFESDPPNEIIDIAGDTITFADDFATTLDPGNHKIRFSDYNNATEDQHRFGFLSDGVGFDDTSTTYRITF